MVYAPGFRSIGYAFPEVSRSVQQLGVEGQLSSSAALLESFGFDRVRVATSESSFDLAAQAARQAMASAGVAPESVELLLYGGTQGSFAFAPCRSAEQAAASLRTLDRFKYPATRLQYELGLVNAWTMGVDQLACATLFGAVRLARALCLSEGIERVLCVSGDVFPAAAGREAIFNCTSDAGCAVLIDRSSERCQIRSALQITKGYYWDCDERRDEIVASYFPTARHAIERAITQAGWVPADVDWIIPHNVSMRSWDILLGLLGLPNARIWSQNIARDGHTLAGDNFINLKDAIDSGAVKPGEKLLLFSYGFGAHWTALAVEA